MATWKELAHYIRECQECGHEAEYRNPATYKGDTWKDTKCKRCKSDALDYGSWRHADNCQCQYCLEDKA